MRRYTSGADATAAAATVPDVPCTKTDALCYGNRDQQLVNSLCEGVQCATMTHVLKLERHWRDVGRSNPAGGHFGCTADDAALCYGNRYSDMRSVYCGGKQCTTPDQAESLGVHWKFHGKNEGRKFGCAPSYESLCYGNRYIDLRRDVCGGGECKTQEQAFRLATHWKESGHLQGRRFGCDMTADAICYADRQEERIQLKAAAAVGRG